MPARQTPLSLTVRYPKLFRLGLLLASTAVGALLVSLGLWVRQAFEPETRFVGIFENDYLRPDDVLGYAPAKGVVRPNASKYLEDELIFRARYTIEANGLRKSGEGPVANPAACVVFFGGSFTFGDGVNDEESMPFRVFERSGGRVATYNFGFHGYGPHQMLAALESRRVEDIVECEAPIYGVYQALLHHVSRAAGLSSWDARGPRYSVDEDGRVTRSGRFDDAALGLWFRARNLSFVRGLVESLQQERDVRLFLGITAAARERFEATYPGRELHVVLWDLPGLEMSDGIVQGLRERGVRLHLITKILPNYPADAARFTIAHDGHPNPLGHDLVAKYVLSDIVGPLEPTTLTSGPVDHAPPRREGY